MKKIMMIVLGMLGVFMQMTPALSYTISGGSTVTYNGTVSDLTSESVIVGSKESANQMILTNGAGVNNQTGTIGQGQRGSSYSSSSSWGSSGSSSVRADNNRVVVSGSGSVWSNSSSLYIGQTYGNNNSLSITDGGRVSNANGTVGSGYRGYYDYYSSYYSSYWSRSRGYSTTSEGNNVTISGPGSTWSSSGSLYVGSQNAHNNSISITDGGGLESARAYLGSGGLSSGDYYSYSARENTIVVSGEGSVWNNSGVLNVGSVYNAVSNSLSVGNGGTVSTETMNIYANNFVYLQDGGTLLISSNYDANQAGEIHWEGGTLEIGGQMTGISMLAVNQRLATADLTGDLTVHGTFAPGNSPADSIVNGDLTIASDGTLEMELGGNVLGTEYDRLTVSGLAELDGTLDLVFLNGFIPENGASFDLFNWDGGVAGTFSDITSSSLSEGLSLDTSEVYTTGTLSVIPEPSSILLMGVVGGAGLFIRRKLRR